MSVCLFPLMLCYRFVASMLCSVLRYGMCIAQRAPCQRTTTLVSSHAISNRDNQHEPCWLGRSNIRFSPNEPTRKEKVGVTRTSSQFVRSFVRSFLLALVIDEQSIHLAFSNAKFEAKEPS
ncbi:hypothetical protein QR685DRAFT_345040 [Neurospora intermedia]|uniref:Secreted protein n=1 Tax=Neurospora intermedia TaxID=5142 RepID=A0ABR3D7C1_NEUIN